jgi:hypothetical protein
MTTFLVAPDDAPDTFDRTYAVLPTQVKVTVYPYVNPVLVAPENVSDYSFPVGVVTA